VFCCLVLVLSCVVLPCVVLFCRVFVMPCVVLSCFVLCYILFSNLLSSFRVLSVSCLVFGLVRSGFISSFLYLVLSYIAFFCLLLSWPWSYRRLLLLRQMNSLFKVRGFLRHTAIQWEAALVDMFQGVFPKSNLNSTLSRPKSNLPTLSPSSSTRDCWSKCRAATTDFPKSTFA
jgi:hypothetical protein